MGWWIKNDRMRNIFVDNTCNSKITVKNRTTCGGVDKNCELCVVLIDLYDILSPRYRCRIIRSYRISDAELVLTVPNTIR